MIVDFTTFIPGGLCSDLVEVMGARESLTVKSYRLDNGDNNCEKTENGTDDELLVKIPFAGTTLSLRLLFYPEEPWIPPDLSFSDIQFASSITTKDLEEQVIILCIFQWAFPYFFCETYTIA